MHYSSLHERPSVIFTPGNYSVSIVEAVHLVTTYTDALVSFTQSVHSLTHVDGRSRSQKGVGISMSSKFLVVITTAEAEENHLHILTRGWERNDWDLKSS